MSKRLTPKKLARRAVARQIVETKMVEKMLESQKRESFNEFWEERRTARWKDEVANGLAREFAKLDARILARGRQNSRI